MSESVKILIEADDKASAKMAAVARNTEAAVKQIKTAGEQTKKSVEFAGSFANALGGTAFGSFAGQIANITEKTSQFAEVSKLGGAGAIAFKAGLVGMAGVLAYNVAKPLGDLIWQTEKLNRQLAESIQKSADLRAAAAKAQSDRFSSSKQDIEIIAEPEEKRVAYRALLEETRKNLSGVEQQARASKKAAEEWAAAWQITGNRQEFARQAKEKADEDKARVKALQEQAMELERIVNLEFKRQDEKYLNSLREELELTQAIADANKEKQMQIQAKASTSNSESEAAALELLHKKEAMRVKELVTSEKERLAIQLAEIVGEKEVARIIELQKKGVDAKTAKELAAHEKRLAAMQQDRPFLEAVESRTLTRSPINQEWIQQRQEVLTGVSPSADVATRLEGALERLAKLFGEEVTRGMKDNAGPKITLEPIR